MEVSYSRTADAESVVLNFAKVLTYSRVLLYTLREREREGERRTEQNRGGRGKGSGGKENVMSVRKGGFAKAQLAGR